MNLNQRYVRDRIVVVVICILSAIVVVPLLIIIGYIIANGLGSLNLNFFTKELGGPERILTGRPMGLMHSILGTLTIDLIALFMAVPFGMSAGIVMSEYREHPLSPILRLMTSTLNGMPAILMGLLAYAVMVKPTGKFSAFAGSVALAFVMVPIIARTTESVLKITPWSLREVGLSLGIPRWKVTLSLVLPAARPGILTGILIAFARAAGEAAPLLLTSLGHNFLSFNIDKPMDTLPQRLYNLAISPYKEWHGMGWGAAIVLLVFVMATFFIGRMVVARMERQARNLEMAKPVTSKTRKNAN